VNQREEASETEQEPSKRASMPPMRKKINHRHRRPPHQGNENKV